MASAFGSGSRGLIPEGFVQELLARVDVVDVVGRHVQLKKGGANLLGLCPFHGEKSPSFTVSPAKQFYHCFGCGAHGDALRFVMEHQGMGFVDAVHELAQSVGLTVPQEQQNPAERERFAQARQQRQSLTQVLEQAAAHYRDRLKSDERAIAYLRGRGLSGEVARQFGLGYAPPGWRNLASAFARYDDALLADAGLVIVKTQTPAASLPADTEDEEEDGSTSPTATLLREPAPPVVQAEESRYDRFRDRIMFPIRSVQGETIGFGGRVLDGGEPKYLNSPETPVFVKGRELYGLFEARSAIRERGLALVVEGYMDVVALAQAGVCNAVATLGTACTTEHVQKLFRFTEHIVFSFDGDKAGRRAAARALEAALPQMNDLRQVRFLFLPQEHDPDSYVRALGADAFERGVQDAVPLSRQLIQQAADGADLGSPEGRARMLSKAQELWRLVPPCALKRQLLGALEEAAQLRAGELAAQWQTATVTPGGTADRRPASEPGDAVGFGRGAQAGRKAFTMPRLAAKAGPRNAAFSGRLRAPPAVADVAVGLLLAQSQLWDSIGAQDQQLLHELGGAHADLVAWLERHVLDHGPSSWPTLAAALEGTGLSEAARRLAPGAATIDGVDAAGELRVLLKRLRLEQLKEQARVLASEAAGDPQKLAQYKEVSSALRALESEAAAPPASATARS